MTRRINRAIELLAQGQAIYYVGGHTGHPLTHDRGRQDAHIWADYINVGMERGSFDMAGLAEYMRGPVEGGRPRHQCGEFAREYLAWCDPSWSIARSKRLTGQKVS